MIELNKVYCEDCQETIKKIPDNYVDLVYCDPPYLKKLLYTYDYLADLCPRILKDGGSLICITPHYALPQIISRFEFFGKLKYRWLLHMNQFDGKHARMAMGIEVTYKILLWYVKRAYPTGRGFVKDGVKITGMDGQNKELHKWQQDSDWCWWISKLTKPGDVVYDPFMGSGTVAEYCIRNGRNFIGSDNDPEACKITEQRIQKLNQTFA